MMPLNRQRTLGLQSLFCGKVFDGELSFALKLAREMGRPDWRAG